MKKISHDKNKFKQYLFINPVSQKVLEGNPQPNEANCTQKSQTTDNLTPVIPKEGKHKHYHQKLTGINNHW